MSARIRGWLLLAALAGLVSAGRGVAGPLGNIPATHLSGTQTSNTVFGDFSWPYAYSLSFTNDTLLAQINIELTGYDPGTALRSTWETGVESTWGRQYEVVDGTHAYPILFDLAWVYTNTLADEIVTVYQGTGYMDMLNWYTSQPSGWPDSYQGVIAAHEVGHMLGLFDEYFGGAVNPATMFWTVDPALMANLGPVQARYYTGMLDWLKNASERPNLTLAPYSPADSQVPEPASVTLIAIGMAGALARRYRLGKA